jgi:hypothetical protein
MKRVLLLTDWKVDALDYRCGQVVDFPSPVAKDLVNLGVADGAPAAVASALEERGGVVLVHQDEALRAAELTVTQAEAALAGALAKADAETDAALRAKAVEDVEAAKQALDEAHAALAKARE